MNGIRGNGLKTEHICRPHRIICKNKILRGIFRERIYRGACGSDSQLHYRLQCDGEADGEEIWDFQIHGAYGSNEIERKIKNTVWIVE